MSIVFSFDFGKIWAHPFVALLATHQTVTLVVVCSSL